MELIIEIIILIVLIVLSALFSGIETATVSISQIKAKALLKQKKKGSKSLYRLKQNPKKLIITILIGNNVANISAAAFASMVFTKLFGSSGVGIATGIMTFMILIFGEITPKSIAIQNSEKVSLAVAKPLEIFSIILTPLIWFFGTISGFVTKLFGVKNTDSLSHEVFLQKKQQK
jgi:putative hemolysin